MTSPNEALTALEQQNAIAEQLTQDRSALGKRMMEVLQTRGEVIIAKWGLYGATPGLMGSYTPGQRLTQSTVPVPIGRGNYVALRHPFLSPSDDEAKYTVELIKTKVSGPGYCVVEPELSKHYEAGTSMAEHDRADKLSYTEDDVIAGYFSANRWSRRSSGLEIAGQPEFAASQLEAVSTLVTYIEDALEPIGEDWQRVAKKLPYEPRIANDVRIREGANTVGDLNVHDFYFS